MTIGDVTAFTWACSCGQTGNHEREWAALADYGLHVTDMRPDPGAKHGQDDALAPTADLEDEDDERDDDDPSPDGERERS